MKVLRLAAALPVAVFGPVLRRTLRRFAAEFRGASARFGPHLVDSSAIYSLGLNRHPMVMEARRRLTEGWQLVVSLGPNHRRPYGNLYFACGRQRVTVNAEGWLKPGWPLDWTRRFTRR